MSALLTCSLFQHLWALQIKHNECILSQQQKHSFEKSTTWANHFSKHLAISGLSLDSKNSPMGGNCASVLVNSYTRALCTASRGVFDCTANFGLSLHPPETDWTIKSEPPLFAVEICSLFHADLFDCLHTNPHQPKICGLFAVQSNTPQAPLTCTVRTELLRNIPREPDLNHKSRPSCCEMCAALECSVITQKDWRSEYQRGGTSVQCPAVRICRNLCFSGPLNFCKAFQNWCKKGPIPSLFILLFIICLPAHILFPFKGAQKCQLHTHGTQLFTLFLRTMTNRCCTKVMGMVHTLTSKRSHWSWSTPFETGMASVAVATLWAAQVPLAEHTHFNLSRSNWGGGAVGEGCGTENQNLTFSPTRESTLAC